MIIKFRNLFSSKKDIPYRFLVNRILKCSLCTPPPEATVQNKIEYLLVLDFEATCDHKRKIEQEIIEFPCLKVNLSNFNEDARFHKYVKPIVNPILPTFCVELTGILQEMVDDEKTFEEVFKLHEEWREKEGLTRENSLYVTSGDWDLGHMIPRQCKLVGIDIPPHMMEWIDIKKLYANHTKQYLATLVEIIRSFKMEFVGRQHSGIDDCLNILNVIREMAKMGVEFKPTSRLKPFRTRYKVEECYFQSDHSQR